MKKRVNGLLLILFCLFFITSCNVGDIRPGTNKNTSSAQGLSQDKTTREDANSQGTGPAVAKEDASAVIAVTGDVLSHERNNESVKKEDGSFDFYPDFEELKPLFEKADYAIANLEAPTAGEKYGYRGFPRFNAPLNLAETLKKVGVDLLVNANNHAMDNGIEGLMDNLDNMDKIGVDHIGTYRSQEEADKPFIKEINGIKVGIVASTYGTNHIDPPNKYNVIRTPKSAEMKAIVQKLRDNGAEVVLWHIHWGKEYTYYPSTVQMDLYKKLTAAGVEVVIGSHPHCLQPIEMRKVIVNGKEKDQGVIWSTGNLYQGQARTMEHVNTGAVFYVNLERKNQEIHVKGIDATPIYLMKWKDGDKEEFKLVPDGKQGQYEATHPELVEEMNAEVDWAKKNFKIPVPEGKKYEWIKP